MMGRKTLGQALTKVFLDRSSFAISRQNQRKNFANNLLCSYHLSQRFYSTSNSITSVNVDSIKNHLTVTWKNNLLDNFPLVWLRDNCQCSNCYNKSSQSRTINFGEFKVFQKPIDVKIIEGEIQVLWDDHHQSLYNVDWLKERSFCEEARNAWLASNQPPYKTWDSISFKEMPVLKFDQIMNNDNFLLQWLLRLEVFGVCLIDEIPNQLGQVKLLAERVAFIKKTHYGEEFSVQAKANANNFAYTSGFLQLHTDLPYYEYKPGINLLHCYVQYKGNGGDSLLSDGFHLAELLKKQDPEAYRILTETEVSWLDIGEENDNQFHKVYNSPVICSSRTGRIHRINFSQPQRDSHFAIPLDQVEGWYRALKKFHDLAQDSKNLVEFKLEPGQMITFNNLRVLHGRTEFGKDLHGERHVQGAYLDWDEARSRIRVLKRNLNKI